MASLLFELTTMWLIAGHQLNDRTRCCISLGSALRRSFSKRTNLKRQRSSSHFVETSSAMNKNDVDLLKTRCRELSFEFGNILHAGKLSNGFSENENTKRFSRTVIVLMGK